jgi:hypothetical protein
VSSTLLTLLVLPAIYTWFDRGEEAASEGDGQGLRARLGGVE